LLYFIAQYQHLALHRRMAYAFQDDCGSGPRSGAFPAVDVPTVLATVEQHLRTSEWESGR
jgi:hypothetical protein